MDLCPKYFGHMSKKNWTYVQNSFGHMSKNFWTYVQNNFGHMSKNLKIYILNTISRKIMKILFIIYDLWKFHADAIKIFEISFDSLENWVRTRKNLAFLKFSIFSEMLKKSRILDICPKYFGPSCPLLFYVSVPSFATL